MFISRTEEIGAWSLTQAAMPLQREVVTPAHVALPHQQLYGVVPMITPQAKEKIDEQTLLAAGHLTTLADDWSSWKPFLQGIQKHSLADELLESVLTSEVNTVKQALALKDLHDLTINAIESQLSDYKEFWLSKLKEFGLSTNEQIADFMTRTVELDIESVFFEASKYTYYSSPDAYLKFTYGQGLAVLDIDLKDKPKPLRDLTVNLINVLACIGTYNTSLDLMYSHSVDQELMEYVRDLSSESRNALKESVFELEDEELALFLNEHHSGVAEEFIDMYGDIDSLIFSLKDCIEFNFDLHNDGLFNDLFFYDDLKTSLNNILAVLQNWSDTQNPLVSHPLAYKLKVLSELLLSHCQYDLVNYFETCSDVIVSDLRVISFDLANDTAALNNLNQYFNDTCENGELKIDLTDVRCLDALKQMRMADVLIGVLVSS
ncbi:hypothetical protein [Tenacibaculum sp.]|jgi:hypothetical protein|uniref:hypothetical protein n=1 Tax=Tenacibaculum sp. TaxID=1906242 RepID=UPI003AA98911